MREKANISFVILHYQALEVTMECIESIMKLDTSVPVNIVVVDNASPNSSGALLKEKYLNTEHVHILVNQKNEGFAKGNNLGYKYAKNELQSTIIIVMNNDVMINQNDFINVLCALSNEDDVHILAPDVITLNNKHQNPLRIKRVGNKELLYIYAYNTIMKYLYRIPIVNQLILNINNNRPRISNRTYEKHNETLYNIVPHGSCIIFLNRWIKEESIAFVPDTFMYCEEDILYEYSIHRNYKIKYTPSLWVKHLEDVSTSTVTKTQLGKALFKAENASFSAKVLLKMRKKSR